MRAPLAIEVTAAAVIASLDSAAFLTVLAPIAVAIIAAILTYKIAIRQGKREIALAFQEHIERLHAKHAEFVDEVAERNPTTKEV